MRNFPVLLFTNWFSFVLQLFVLKIFSDFGKICIFEIGTPGSI
jgi:hypothetical protein